MLQTFFVVSEEEIQAELLPEYPPSFSQLQSQCLFPEPADRWADYFAIRGYVFFFSCFGRLICSWKCTFYTFFEGAALAIHSVTKYI